MRENKLARLSGKVTARYPQGYEFAVPLSVGRITSYEPPYIVRVRFPDGSVHSLHPKMIEVFDATKKEGRIVGWKKVKTYHRPRTKRWEKAYAKSLPR